MTVRKLAVVLGLLLTAACGDDGLPEVEGTWELRSIDGEAMPVALAGPEDRDVTLARGSLGFDAGTFELAERIEERDAATGRLISSMELGRAGTYDVEGDTIYFETDYGEEWIGVRDGSRLTVEIVGDEYVFVR